MSKIPKQKAPGPDGLTAEFYGTLMYMEAFQKIEAEGTLPNSFCEVGIIFIPELAEDITRKKNYRPISLINTAAKILKILAKLSPTMSRENYHN